MFCPPVFSSLGAGAPSAGQQLGTCLNQTLCLVRDLKDAIQSVTMLTLAIVDDETDCAQDHTPAASAHPADVDQQMLQQQAAPEPSGAGLASLLCAVNTMLAAALPNLRELSLVGRCWEPALHVFGACCPLLSHLIIEALHVPLSALYDLHVHLPNLTAFTYSNLYAQKKDEQELGQEIDAIFTKLQRCTKLARLRIELPDSVVLKCKPESWLLLPQDILHLECSCPIEDSDEFHDITMEIPNLCVYDWPGFCGSLSEMFNEWTLLDSLKVATRTTIHLDCDRHACLATFNPLKERLLARPFHLECSGLIVSGTSEEICEAFVWMPSFPFVKKARFLFQDAVQVNCLEQVSRVFPALEWLGIEDGEGWKDAWTLDDSFLSPLASCTNLRTLHVCAQLRLTTAGLTRLCRGAGRLTHCSFCPCDGVDGDELAVQLVGSGREVMIELQADNRDCRYLII